MATKDDPRSSEIDEREIKKIKRLGEGCFGVVWKGECFAKPVAIKYPHIQQLSKEELEDLRREIHIMATNPHPNIVQFMGACTVPGKFAIIMELLDGNLEDLLLSDEGKKLRLFQRLLMAKDAALGMNRLHRTEPAIIHRDFKLENLMYKKTDHTYTVKVADFGLSVIKPKAKKTIREEAKGTPLTRAPEIMQDKPFNQAADVYSFGMTLWEIVTCQELFPHHSDYDVFMEAICEHGERPPIPPDCLPSLRSLMEDCWTANPNRRPEFEEINKRLDEILVEAAINDPKGREFWKKYFLKEHTVKWRDFAERFYQFLGLELPEDRGGSTSPAVLNYRCLRALVAHRETDSDRGSQVHIQTFGDILDWFSGMDVRDGETVLDRMRLLLENKWFHGDISSNEAARRFRGKEPGTFLVRFTTNADFPGAFTITRFSQQETVSNIRVIQDKNGFYVNKNSVHPTLETLILDLQDTLFLKFPCDGSRFQSLFEGVEDDFAGYEVLTDTLPSSTKGK
jgi:serine/threonine protein kinase